MNGARGAKTASKSATKKPAGERVQAREKVPATALHALCFAAAALGWAGLVPFHKEPRQAYNVVFARCERLSVTQVSSGYHTAFIYELNSAGCKLPWTPFGSASRAFAALFGHGAASCIGCNQSANCPPRSQPCAPFLKISLPHTHRRPAGPISVVSEFAGGCPLFPARFFPFRSPALQCLPANYHR
jgi:hypothetical protein